MGDNGVQKPSSEKTNKTGKTSPEMTLSQSMPRSEASDSNNASPSPEPDDADSKPSVPMQKRRRVTRACDECRRKKIKCDGKQPCTHCTVYSYECTYDQPSNRRRNPAPQYIEALEQRLQKSEAILRVVLPGVDIDDPEFDAHGVDQILEASRAARNDAPGLDPKAEEDPQMQSMVDQTGALDLDDTGHWDFHGHSSGYMFMRRFRAKFGDSLIPIPKSPDNKTFSQVIDSPKSAHSSLFDLHAPTPSELPPRDIALEYCRVAIDVGCALTRPFHRPTFFRRLNNVYNRDPEQWETEDVRFIPLMFSVMAFGCLFAPGDAESLDKKGYKHAIEQGYHWFNASKSTADITDCRDLMSVQTVIFMVFFLQGSAKLATCYSYIGIALRACCRLGMHRNVAAHFNAIEQEERKRAFWLVRNMDTYVGTMLGLPQMLADHDIDQAYPTEVHDDCIVDTGIVTTAKSAFSLIRATNAHTKLTDIMKKVLVYVYPLKQASPSQNGPSYTVGHSRIKELERDLQNWMDELPMELRPSGHADTELSRVQQLLRMSYAYVQITMYRPFLHYVSPTCQGGRTDKRSFACAAACVSVARNIVHITSEMRRRGLLGGAYWFVMYITYFAILSLVYFVLENPESSASQDVLRDAREGHETLVALSKRSFAADRCSQSLKSLFEELPEKLKERRSSLQSTPNTSRKRSQPSDATVTSHTQPSNVSRAAIPASKIGPPARARTIPHDYLARAAKRSSLPNSPSHAVQTLQSSLPGPDPAQVHPVNDTLSASPHGTPAMNQFAWSTPSIQQESLPDLQNVMFPSDNPFAYGNQPIMTLEDSSFSGFGDPTTFGPEQQFGTPAETNFPTPQSLPGQGQQTIPQRDFDMRGIADFGEQFGPSVMQQQQQHQQQHHQQQQQSGGFDGSGQNIYGMPQGFKPRLQQQQQQQPEDYWTNGQHQSQQPNRMQFRPGTGFSHSPGGVNLDELFGGGNGWGSVNMIDMGIPGATVDDGNNNTTHENAGLGGTQGWGGQGGWM